MGENRTPDQERAAGTRTIQEATRIASKHGKVLAVKQFSTHPDDDYLYVVLVETPPQANIAVQYVTWEVNTSCPSCFSGHYFHQVNNEDTAVEDAFKDFNKRGRL